jgi:hypothetical protein
MITRKPQQKRWEIWEHVGKMLLATMVVAKLDIGDFAPLMGVS